MPPSRSLLVAATLVLVSPLWDSQGRAQSSAEPPPSVRLEAVGCEPELVRSVEAALAVELSMAASETREGLAAGALRCLLTCDASTAVAAVLRAEQRIEQRVPRDEAGLPRRLAVVLAELLEAASSGPLEPPPPQIESPVEPVGPPLAVRLRLAGGAWLGGDPWMALGGAELGVEVAPLPEVAVVAAFSGAHGGVEVAAGRVDVWLLSGSASVRFGADVDALYLSGGPAVRGGAVAWTGHPRDPLRGVGRDVLGGWLGLGVVAAAHLRVGELPLRVGLEAEGGGVAFSSTALAYGAVAASVAAGWIEARFVIDLTLG